MSRRGSSSPDPFSTGLSWVVPHGVEHGPGGEPGWRGQVASDRPGERGGRSRDGTGSPQGPEVCHCSWSGEVETLSFCFLQLLPSLICFFPSFYSRSREDWCVFGGLRFVFMGEV